MAKKGEHLSDEQRALLKQIAQDRELRGERNLGYRSYSKGKKMSDEQKEKIRQSILKKWEGKERKIKRLKHEGSEYRRWRLSIYTRDSFTCQNCRNVGGHLEAHHIKSWSEYPELRYKSSNGITLCQECHKLTDGYGNRKKTKPCLG